MARIERLTVYPVKGLDGIDLEEATVLEGGTLSKDREFALFDDEGDVINGKRTARIHDLSTDFDSSSGELVVESPADEPRRFDLETAHGRERAEHWFGEYFDETVTLERDRSLGFVDRREMGPSVVSTASLRTVASWFDGMTVDGARRRLRANVEIAGVPPFWEDRLVGQDAATLDASGVRLEGVTPCARCVVPQRDPDTGERIDDFRERFAEKRRETFPAWADEAAFDHYYTLMVIARVPESDRQRSLAVGDSVTIVDD
ncbi:MOSC domain-containing protein [Natrarchaeobius chitinivorans]|uniref:MOSC domain-containing protein n=1 Tax=Natrarchaeobius chitinivorans TaxID=1679083 RepID=A0A3N6LUQ6_NATCH|nr:MOSC N-terminal beta barrel domain-containing protein [Natrarchaeobius chitinivorans]RQG94048.1 MOSC domain-containing protein [Natrarchaeobius chitinivorans]